MAINLVPDHSKYGPVVEPVVDPPTLTTEETCIVKDVSESLMIRIISDLPDAATLSVEQMKENGEYIAELEDLPELFINDLLKNGPYAEKRFWLTHTTFGGYCQCSSCTLQQMHTW